MNRVSNKQLSKQITKLDAKLEVLMALLERNEKTMFSFFGRQKDLRDNLSKIGDVYSKVRDNLNDVYKKIDEFCEVNDNGSGEL